MATCSSVLAWRIPGTGKPGGCRLWGRTESDTTEATQQQQQQQQQHTVHGVAKSQTQLRDFHFHFSLFKDVFYHPYLDKTNYNLMLSSKYL